jgi:serine/threonine protein kinase
VVSKNVSYYTSLDKIRDGGMGTVCKAEDTTLHRTVTLKSLRSKAVEDEEPKTRFQREAEAGSSLDHPNIFMVREINEAEGQTFLVMAYMEGETVAQRAKKRPPPLNSEEALDSAVRVAEGLHGVDWIPGRPASTFHSHRGTLR